MGCRGMNVNTIALIISDIAVIGGAIIFFGKIWRKIKCIADGHGCMLRNEITSIYYRHIDEEEPTLREYERKNLDELYAAYEAGGFNHFVKDIYAVMRKWPVTK